MRTSTFGAPALGLVGNFFYVSVWMFQNQVKYNVTVPKRAVAKDKRSYHSHMCNGKQMGWYVRCLRRCFNNDFGLSDGESSEEEGDDIYAESQLLKRVMSTLTAAIVSDHSVWLEVGEWWFTTRQYWLWTTQYHYRELKQYLRWWYGHGIGWWDGVPSGEDLEILRVFCAELRVIVVLPRSWGQVRTARRSMLRLSQLRRVMRKVVERGM